MLNSVLAQWSLWSEDKPKLIRQLKGGLTNSSFLIQTKNKKRVLRINAENSTELDLNRETEYQVLSLKGIEQLAPRLVYCDPERKFLVTDYLEGNVWSEQEFIKQENIVSLAKLLKAIHRLPAVHGTLKQQQKAKRYWQQINPGNPVTQLIETIQDDISWHFTQVIKQCDKPCLCHNDLLASNLISSNNGNVYAIDWEYAAMGDPYFDLAVLIESNQLDKIKIQLLLKTYLENPAEQVFFNALQRLRHSRVIYCYLSLLWYTLQDEYHGGINSPYKEKMAALASRLLDKRFTAKAL